MHLQGVQGLITKFVALKEQSNLAFVGSPSLMVAFKVLMRFDISSSSCRWTIISKPASVRNAQHALRSKQKCECIEALRRANLKNDNVFRCCSTRLQTM